MGENPKAPLSAPVRSTTARYLSVIGKCRKRDDSSPRILAMFVLLLLGWIFLPVYMASGVFTVPEYLQRRFGGTRIETLLSIFSLLNYIFTKISADLYAGSLFIHACFNLNTYPAIVALLFLAAIFTITGGQTSVIWVDLIQTILMIAGALTVTIIGFHEVGGYDALMHDFYYKKPSDSVVNFDANNDSCNQITEEYRHLLRPVTDMDLPWTGAIFGITISALWYWCSDQLIVQRGLAARNMSHGKAGCILAGYCKFLPLWLMVFPGMISRVLYIDEIGCSDPDACADRCGIRTGCSNNAYPLLVINLLPKGVRGLMLSVMLATLMCSLSAVFNSSSTVFTVNIWSKIRKKASQLELLIIGRVFVLFMLAVAVAWIPVMSGSQNARLFDYLQSVTSCLAPPVCASFVLAMLSERPTEQGIFWGLLIGFAVGLCRFGLEFGYPAPVCGSGVPDTRPLILSAVHYLHFGILLFLLVIVIEIAISLMTKPVERKKLVRLTYWTIHSTELRMPIQPPNTDDTDDQTDDRTSGYVNNGFSEYPVPVETIPMDTISDRPRIPVPLGSHPRKSIVRRFLEVVLGLPSSSEVKVEDKMEKTPEEDLQEAIDVFADTKWNRLVDMNGVLLLAAAAFIWGYFA